MLGLSPRTKKTSNQVVMRGKHPKVLPSKQFLAWFNAAMFLVPGMKREAAAEGITLPFACQVEVKAVIYVERNYGGDLTGYMQAIGDWIQDRQMTVKNGWPKLKRDGAGFITDDRNIASWDGTRLFVDRVNPRIEIEIRPYQGQLNFEKEKETPMTRMADIEMTVTQIASFTGLTAEQVVALMGTPEGPKSRRYADVADWVEAGEEMPREIK